MKIEYIRSKSISRGKSFGTLLQRCYICGKVTPRICSIDGKEFDNLGQPLRVCRNCEKENKKEVE